MGMLKLHSVISSGFGKNTEFISFIYSYLLKKYNLNFYNRIVVNHIGDDLQEKIFHNNKSVHINIRFLMGSDFSLKDETGKNKIFLKIIHEGLVRLAKEDGKMSIEVLKLIKGEILSKKFIYSIEHMSIINKKDHELVAKIIIRPSMTKFCFYILIMNRDQIKCETLIYQGGASDYYLDDLFGIGKWKGLNEFIIKGRRSEIEFHVYVDSCKIRLVNTSIDKNKAPIFNLFRADASSQELQDYISSLPPGVGASITYNPN